MNPLARLVFLLAASGNAVSATGCPVTDRDLLGAWRRDGDAGFFEEFSLEEEAGARTFSSWLHQRPELSGAGWRLEKCTLIVAPRHGEFAPFRLRILGLEQGRLRWQDDAENTESVYVRLPDEP